MVYIVTSLRQNIREFNGVFRTREEADAYIEANSKNLGFDPLVIAERFEIGQQKKKVYVAQHYFEKPEDLFGYAGVFEDFNSALRKSGGIGAGVYGIEL